MLGEGQYSFAVGRTHSSPQLPRRSFWLGLRRMQMEFDLILKQAYFGQHGDGVVAHGERRRWLYGWG